MSEPTRRPIVWPIFVLWFGVLGFVTVVTIVVMLAGAFWLQLNGELPNPDEVGFEGMLQAVLLTPGVLHLSMAITSLSLLAGAFAGVKLERAPDFRERLRLVSRPRNALIGAIAFVAVVTVGQAMESAVPRSWLEGTSLETIAQVVSNQSLPWFLLLLVLGSVGPGFAEELFFRGFAQARLVERWGRWAGILIASVLFGVTHADPIHTPLAFGMGVLIGWIADRVGSIWPGIAAHGFNNATSFALTRAVPSETLVGWELQVGAASAVLCALSVWAIAGLTAVRTPAPASAPTPHIP